MAVLVTGLAGFIGFHVTKVLIVLGEQEFGVDNLNDYYDVSLKQARLAQLRDSAFSFARIDVSDYDAVLSLIGQHEFRSVVHLATQAGIQYSVVNPYAYVQSNVMGHVVPLEAARAMAKLEHFVYASSSSVYGLYKTLPFKGRDRVDHPSSLYAATKRADEFMGHHHAHLYGLPQTDLRFFTVYGPWGRPDMRCFSFAKAIIAGEPITLYEWQNLDRDSTYVDDIVSGIQSGLVTPLVQNANLHILDLRKNEPERVAKLVCSLEHMLEHKIAIIIQSRPTINFEKTWADVSDPAYSLGYSPKVGMEEGISHFACGFYSAVQQAAV